MSGRALDRRARRDAVRALKALSSPATLRRDGSEVALERPGSGRGAERAAGHGTGEGGAEGSRRIRVPARVLDALLRSGAVRRDGARVARTPAGTAMLRRLLSDPDATHAEQHRERRAGTIERDGAREAVTFNAVESPLGRLAALRERDGSAFLHPEAAEAGRRLLSDFERAQLRPSVTMRWEMGASTGSAARGADRSDPTDSAMAARRRYERAVAALGPRLGPALVDAVCHEMGLADVERRHDWPARSGKMLLREALERLAAHYRGA